MPEVLLSGNQALIDEYKRIDSLVETWQKRPDMLDKIRIPEEDWEKMIELKTKRNSDE